ncbi:aldo/keto reductase [Kushneria aurantia]|uniref:Aldo/keto reductase n=1 Tax=Kushneria aurantia TaxID=504092 RepID=A0ABV6FZ48_9GAMM|nr:aldo/keto reductase [Kushneria aurantia]
MSMVDAPFVIGLSRLHRYDALLSSAGLARWLSSRVDEGLHWFDHAPIDGGGEFTDLLGRAIGLDADLARNMRLVVRLGVIPALQDSSGMGTKHYDTSPEGLERSLTGVLKALGVERIDTLLLMRPDPLMDVAATGRALDAFIADGRVKRVGVANFLPAQWRHLQSAMQTPLACQQLPLSVAHNTVLFDGLWQSLQQDGMTGLACSPLWGGRIFENQLGQMLGDLARRHNVSPAGVALAWLTTLPGRPVPVVGTLREKRLRTLASDAGLTLSRPEWFALLEAARAFRVP